MLVTAYNPETDDYERTYLSNANSAGVTSLKVRNNNKFAANDRVMIGEMGRERTEILTVSSVSGGDTIVLSSGTVFAHDADDPIYILRYDQVKFYRSTSGSGGTYSILTTVALDVDNENLTTVYDDTSGLSSYYYKISFYHSISTQESDLSDAVPGGGYDRNTVGFLIDEILEEVKDQTEQFTSRKEILGWFNEVSDILSKRTKKPWSFLHTRTTATRTASQAYISYPTNVWKFDRIDYVYNPDSSTNITYPLRFKPMEEFRRLTEDNTASESDELKYYTIDTAVDLIRLYPTPDTTAATAFYIHYWKTFTQIDSEGDTFETPDPRCYKLYVLSRFYRNKSASDSSYLSLSNLYSADFYNEITDMLRTNRKEVGSPNGFRYLPQTYKGNRKY